MMKIEVYPNCLSKYQITKDSLTCPKCNHILDKKMEQIMEQDECRACNLGVFTTNCNCTYHKINICKIICSNCNKNN